MYVNIIVDNGNILKGSSTFTIILKLFPTTNT